MAELFPELSTKARRQRVREAVDGILREAGEPLATSALVKRTALFLGLDELQQNVLARFITDLAREHPLARKTGETFKRFGRDMQRWEWLPDYKAPGLSRAEIERRRTKIAMMEGDGDIWTVPPSVEPGLEDE